MVVGDWSSGYPSSGGDPSSAVRLIASMIVGLAEWARDGAVIGERAMLDMGAAITERPLLIGEPLLLVLLSFFTKVVVLEMVLGLGSGGTESEGSVPQPVSLAPSAPRALPTPPFPPPPRRAAVHWGYRTRPLASDDESSASAEDVDPVSGDLATAAVGLTVGLMVAWADWARDEALGAGWNVITERLVVVLIGEPLVFVLMSFCVAAALQMFLGMDSGGCSESEGSGESPAVWLMIPRRPLRPRESMCAAWVPGDVKPPEVGDGIPSSGSLGVPDLCLLGGRDGPPISEPESYTRIDRSAQISVPVHLNVYHVGKTVYRHVNGCLGLMRMGGILGVYHSVIDVEFWGSRYQLSYGTADDAESGVLVEDVSCDGLQQATANEEHTWHQTINLGTVMFSWDEFMALLRSLEGECRWLGCQYDLYRNNCNHFSAAVLAKLKPYEEHHNRLKPFPLWVNRAANLVVAVSDAVNSDSDAGALAHRLSTTLVGVMRDIVNDRELIEN